MSLTAEQIKNVKGRGFLLNRGTDCFSGRVVVAGGSYSAKDLKAISECADKFGKGQVIFTSRLAAEIPGIPFESIDAACDFLAANGLYFGGTGAKIRPITACKGTTCVFGNIDTHKLARELHEYFYVGLNKVALPHKFKIGVGGCPNSCMKPSLNDVGIEGKKVFSFDESLCKGCKKCFVAENCPVNAISFDGGKAIIDRAVCNNCGNCIGKCPFGAVPKQSEAACLIYVGGTWGKSQRIGSPLSRLVSEDKVIETVEKIFLWYRKNGYVKERLGHTIDRVGFEQFEKDIFSNELLERKEEILSAPLKEKTK